MGAVISLPSRPAEKRQRAERRRTAPEPEAMLKAILPDLRDAEQLVRDLRRLADEQRRLLAAKRGVAFIRHEHVVAEFGQ